MGDYGRLLKNLIDATGTKLSLVAETVGYDVSYVSKWCSGSKLPSKRSLPEINAVLGELFASELESRDQTDAFRKEWHIRDKNTDLKTVISRMLTEAYPVAADTAGPVTYAEQHLTRILTSTKSIHEFFYRDIFRIILECEEPVDILCTLDLKRICTRLLRQRQEVDFHPDYPVNVKIMASAQAEGRDLENAYFLLGQWNTVSFDVYRNTHNPGMNMIVIRDHLAVQVSLDADDRVIFAAVTRDPEDVKRSWLKVSPIFRSSDLLVRGMNSERFYDRIFRADFYAAEKYKFLTSHGFEFLLPESVWGSMVRSVKEESGGSMKAKMIKRLQIMWEEIFENSEVDFFVTESILSRYLEDGEILFMDIPYHMTAEERRLHIAHVLEVAHRNPKMHFYLIDEENLPLARNMFRFSLFYNDRILYLKNAEHYCGTECPEGPGFYFVLSNTLGSKIGDLLESYKSGPYCREYDAASLDKFMERYGSMVYRMIDLS